MFLLTILYCTCSMKFFFLPLNYLSRSGLRWKQVCRWSNIEQWHLGSGAMSWFWSVSYVNIYWTKEYCNNYTSLYISINFTWIFALVVRLAVYKWIQSVYFFKKIYHKNMIYLFNLIQLQSLIILFCNAWRTPLFSYIIDAMPSLLYSFIVSLWRFWIRHVSR